MFQNIKKIVAYVLTLLVLFLTVIALLGIWDIISFEYVILKILKSLFVVFLASVIMLFIFGVLIKEEEK